METWLVLSLFLNIFTYSQRNYLGKEYSNFCSFAKQNWLVIWHKTKSMSGCLNLWLWPTDKHEKWQSLREKLKPCTQLANHCMMWAWLLDCRFWKVSEIVAHWPSNSDIRKMWGEGMAREVFDHPTNNSDELCSALSPSRPHIHWSFLRHVPILQ